MPKSTTRFVKTKKIGDSGIASVLARLMMIVNDMAIVNESLRVWSPRLLDFLSTNCYSSDRI